MKNAAKKSRSMTTGMIRVLLLAQIIPYIVLSAVIFRGFAVRNTQQIRSVVSTSMGDAGRLVAEKITDAIEFSRQASYDGIIKDSYEAWRENGDESAMYREVSSYLNKTYKFSKTISNTILLYREPMQYEYYTYSNAAGATYASIDEFRQNTAEAVRLTAADMGTATRLIYLAGHLYIVRNIVRSNYDPFATLVMEVNTDVMFSGLSSIVYGEAVNVMLDGDVIYASAETAAAAELPAADTLSWPELPVEGKNHVTCSPEKSFACMILKINGQYLYFSAQLRSSEIRAERFAFASAYAVIFITLIPLLIAIFVYFYHNINLPVTNLIRGSEKIRQGEYGYRVEPFDKNEEMRELTDTFNHMSDTLRSSFEKIYLEEIAQRDATLKALQSQINPHFLNNTLEIINWKARLSGNDDVSGMIEALSVMMNATLGRDGEMLIPLAQEMEYVDAYLYIIRQRFGEKFQFDRSEVPQTLLQLKIPRLIIQPIIENAVEHGGDRYGRITGCLRVRLEGNILLIEVENNGRMTQEDREKISRLLQDTASAPAADQPGSSGSIGIRNVHRRLRMIYGEKSGLAIEDRGENLTVSTIRIEMADAGGHDPD